MTKEVKKITPAMKQYFDMKSENEGAILFFQMGDFFEMFYEDAKTASKVLNIALTSRDKEKKVPMCGFPLHAASTYINKLVKEGFKVAICEQITDPQASKGIVERAVTRVVTIGTAFEDEHLHSKTNNYIACVLSTKEGDGFAYMDLSTGEFRVTDLPSQVTIYDELKKINPSEVILFDKKLLKGHPYNITEISEYDFDVTVAEKRLLQFFSLQNLDGFGLGNLSRAVSCGGALLNYVKETLKRDLSHINKCLPYNVSDYLILDSNTRGNLDITINQNTKTLENTLFDVMDKTLTPMGGRALYNRLSYPMINADKINNFHVGVAEFLEETFSRRRLTEVLKTFSDLERICSRITLNSGSPRDLITLKDSLKKIPEIKNIIETFKNNELNLLKNNLDNCEDIVALIDKTIIENPSINMNDGFFVKEGFLKDLDDLRDICTKGKDFLTALEIKERERSGINTLKVGYNRVFGYYIDVPRSKAMNVPEDFIRKQTLANNERFITPELKEWEVKILNSEEKAKELEFEIFSNLVKEIVLQIKRIQNTCSAVALIDLMSSFATLADDNNYARPVVNDTTNLKITEGRHPVIEKIVTDGFISNDIEIDTEDNQIIILTGPNMAGKSTYIRQVALIVLMAQAGSFVPAKSAEIGVIDRIFTRIGASDDLARGQSTFMVEMSETANILNNATNKSLVILDEMGRGTSTFDGLSIAWAVCEHLHDNDKVRCKTLFATHYHELTDLNLTKNRVKNYNVTVKEYNGDIMFMRKVEPGGTNRSYGIEVAKLAGFDKSIIKRAEEILKNLEKGELNEKGLPSLSTHDKKDLDVNVDGQMSLLGKKDKIHEEINELDPDNLTPIEAISILAKLKKIQEEENK